MNKKLFLISTLLCAIISISIGIWIGKNSGSDSKPISTTVESGFDPKISHGEHKFNPSKSASVWTCSMHPQVKQPDPGKCPICAMNLIPLEKENETELEDNKITLSNYARKLAEIETSTVIRDFPDKEVNLVGQVDYDETRMRVITARFPARVDRLFVNYTGIPVNKGDHLALIYSPQLLTAQNELITALKFDQPGATSVEASREKLRLWDLMPDQIAAIEELGSASNEFELRAPLGGIVVEKNINEGDYFETGEVLFRIADLRRLWIILDAYETDLPWLHYGQETVIETQARPGKKISGKIVFIDPVMDRSTRTVKVRVEVDNHDGLLKPGMFVSAIVTAEVAHDGQVYAPELLGKWISPMHPQVVKDQPGQCDVCGMDLIPAEDMGFHTTIDKNAPLLVPASAVLRTGKRAIVFISTGMGEKPIYEARNITLGPRAGDYFIVYEGLLENEIVVTNGAFKLDSSMQIKAMSSMMNPTAGIAAPSHNHDNRVTGKNLSNLQQNMSPDDHLGIAIPSSEVKALLGPYFNLHSALAGDDLDKAKKSIKAMISTVGNTSPIAELIHEMLEADSLDQIRRPAFETLSKSLIQAIQGDPSALDGHYYLMHCPMVYDDRGADWLQKNSELLNPYFGDMMLHCGEIKEKLGESNNDQ